MALFSPRDAVKNQVGSTTPIDVTEARSPGKSATPKSSVTASAWAWWVVLLFGMVNILAGAIVLALPDISIVTLAWVSGVFLLVNGAFDLVDALDRGSESRDLFAFRGVLSVIGGLLLVRHPIASAQAVGLILGIWLVAIGLVRLSEVVVSSRQRWKTALLGVVDLVAGIVLVAALDVGVVALAWIVGFAFLLRGIVAVATAWPMWQASHRR